MKPECPDYVADIGTRRCRSYIDGGTCSRPDQFVCTEWQRANARAPSPTPRLAQVVQLRPKTAPAAPRNEHWSFSRLTRFEGCPLSYKLHYLDKLPSEPGEPLQFGKAIHAVLEKLYAEHTLDEKVGGLDVQRALALFQIEWASAGLVGTALFREGIEMLETYCSSQGVVDHRSVLAIEKEFRLPIGRGEVLGYIDRIDRIDDTTIEVVDYKTNRQLATSPVCGVRHTPSATTTGWFLWSGENDGTADFFVPLHAEHLLERHRHLLPMLGGVPGWCFMVAPDDPDYEDVWFDPEIAAIVG